METADMKSIFIIFVFGMALIGAAHGKTCSPRDAEAADAMIGHLDSWTKFESAFKRFRHCDDGSIAEGNSEAVARLLVNQWNTLPLLAGLIKRDPPLKRFVLRHIDTTLDTDDLEKIKESSSLACRKDMALLCSDLKIAAIRAIK